ncbi:MAG: ParA family protein [Hyphomicrobiaceae bacterium]
METELSLVERLWREIARTELSDMSVKLMAAVIVTALTPVIVYLLRKFWAWASGIALCNRKLARAKKAVADDGRGLWLNIEPAQPDRYRDDLEKSIPIITLANLKGGVGKTTTAANLIAHFAIKKGKRVLGIDLDFQGSLSGMALSKDQIRTHHENQASGERCKASRLIANRDADWLVNIAEPVANVASARLVPAFYTLAGSENRLMVEWLLGLKTDDIRYNLAATLLNSRVQRQFDLIVIDAPPRLTTACIQALCASTHVLIPSILDKTSAVAVGTFADQLVNHEELWPHLQVIGALGTMASQNPFDAEGQPRDRPLSDTEADAYIAMRDTLRAALERSRTRLKLGSILPEACLIPDKAEIGRAAGNVIAYAQTGSARPVLEIRAIFDRLGDEIDRRLKT